MAGLAYLPLTVTVFAISQVVPRLTGRLGARALLCAGSLLGFTLLGESDGYFPGVLIPLLIHAAGIALVFAPGTVAIMHGVPAEQAGPASGLLQMDQQIGGALGIAVLAAVAALVAWTAIRGRVQAIAPAAPLAD